MSATDASWRSRLEAVGRALSRKGITALVVETGDEAREKALALIPRGASVGIGGSKTVAEIGLLDALRSGDYKFIDQYSPGLDKETAFEARRDSLKTDFFVSGTNAVTEDGKLVNTDGMGNRVAAFAFGPRHVIMVVGRNKMVKDLAAAVDRIRNTAAPLNAKRLGSAVPCATTGVCSDCDSPGRICNLTLIIEGQRLPGRMTVILINQELGF